VGRLTTHVLDTARGLPAAGVEIEVWRITANGERRHLATARTNANGRTDVPLLEDADLTAGIYELVFAVGDYFARQEGQMPSPPFLDRVPIRVGIADPTAHYHIPLLASPWAYSTYRGS
jgi:5-hydroxyisourate hydrolase